ncbi:MAG TPA: hypothetical protein VFT67_00400 [Jatrophihabitantaceae bacterium]|nr:hypothetical protein [Jatrophihabitantaceae bacterium]
MSERSQGLPEGVELFDTPEEAALAGWRSTPAAHARVIAVEPIEDFDGVYVTVQTDGHPDSHDRDIAACVRTLDGRWYATSSSGV